MKDSVRVEKLDIQGPVLKLLVRHFYSMLALNGKGILMVILSLLPCSFSLLS
jgi:hypothetical protein